ncbi:MAG: YdiU family protein [Sandaracinaceae bacterium]
MSLTLEHTYYDQLDGAYVNYALPGSPNPKLVAFNAPLAEELGLSRAQDEITAIVSGNRLPADAHVLAMAYAGHQFGHLSPLLGDGRAALVGELIDVHGQRRDLHLKGSGRTPFSRGGDGRATLGPILREYLVAEGMHHLGVPTSRVLAAMTTGDLVQREKRLPGAVLGRVASSHLRVGTFELFALRRDAAMLEKLIDYALDRHYPERRSGDGAPALALLEGVADAQANLIAKWMQVGFVHGVMNTDNVTISGETIDYGPCAFIDTYEPAAVFSSIDHGARYAFQNQPIIGAWNLARFAETLLNHIDPDPETSIRLATDRIEAFQDSVASRLRRAMRRKIGLPETEEESLVSDLLDTMEQAKLDYTSTFRRLSSVLRGDAPPASLASWVEGWRGALAERGLAEADVAAKMDAENPVYIPRNHLVEDALAAAHEDDLGPFEALLEAITRPFEARDLDPRYAAPAPETFGPYRTFCGT